MQINESILRPVFGSVISSNRGGGLPAALNLNFTTQSYSAGGTPSSFADLLDFSRTTTGTYRDSAGALQTAAINEPRFDYDGNGNALGLLVESASTNIIAHSEALASGVWAGFRQAVTPLAGGGSVVTCTQTSPNGAVANYPVTDIGIGDTWTFTVLVEKNSTCSIRVGAIEATSFEGDYVSVDMDGSFVINDFVASICTPSASVESAGDLWEITFTGANFTAAPDQFRIYLVDSKSSGAITIGNALNIRYAQIEEGAVSTSYIPTDGATVTRAQDSCVYSGVDSEPWFAQDVGTWYTEHSPYAGQSDGRFITVGSASNRRMIMRMRTDSSEMNLLVQNGGGAIVNLTTSITDPSPHKFAVSYQLNLFVMALDGAIAGTDTSATVPTIDQIQIGAALNGASAYAGHIKELRWYNTALDDSTLEAITL